MRKRLRMTTNATQAGNAAGGCGGRGEAGTGLAIVRVTIGAMLVWVFFENLGKGLYTPGGYAGLINYYIKSSHSPAVWKAVWVWPQAMRRWRLRCRQLRRFHLGSCWLLVC